jgi:hypothetical protein
MGIKSYIQGRYVENVWEVQCDRDEKTGKITKKPRIRFDAHFKYETLQNAHGENFIVDGEIGTNSTCGWLGLVVVNKINLSEDEEVTVIQKIYRADLHAYMVHTDKVLSEKDIDKEEAEFKYNKLLAEYNKTMIEADEELLSYCKVHKLVPAETDYEELRKVVPQKVKVSPNELATYGAIGYTDTGITTHFDCIKTNINDMYDARISALESKITVEG